VAEVADAVVVGSALVKLIAEHEHEPETMLRIVSDALHAMRKAMDAGHDAGAA